MSFGFSTKKSSANNQGLIYMGAKRGIAEDILNVIRKREPNRNTFIDLFGGGGSISLLADQYFNRVVYNEFNPIVARVFQYFKTTQLDIVRDLPWISPADFKAIHARFNENPNSVTPIEGFQLMSYSFSGKVDSYIYNPRLALYKEQLHYFTLYPKDHEKYIQSVQFFKELFHFAPHLVEQAGEYLKSIDSWEAQSAFSHNFINIMSGVEAIISHLAEQGKDYAHILYTLPKTAQAVANSPAAYVMNLVKQYAPDIPLKSNPTGERNQAKLESQAMSFGDGTLSTFNAVLQLPLKFTPRLEHLANAKQIVSMNLPHRNIEFNGGNAFEFDFNQFNPTDTIVFCDPPYFSTAEYMANKKDGNGFPHDKLYELLIDLQSKGFAVYMSEYSAPANWKSIWEKVKRVTLAGGGRALKYNVEKLFIPPKKDTDNGN